MKYLSVSTSGSRFPMKVSSSQKLSVFSGSGHSFPPFFFLFSFFVFLGSLFTEVQFKFLDKIILVLSSIIPYFKYLSLKISA